MPVRHQCSALRSAIALPPRCQSILGRWLVDLRIVDQLALTGYWTTHAAEWPPASKICTMERCSPLDERAVADLHSSGYFGATLWLSTTGINEVPTRHSSCPGAARLLDRAFQGAIVSHGGQNVALGCCQEQVALRQTQNVRRPRLWRAGSRRSGALRRANGNAPQPKCATREQHPRRRLHPTYAEGFCVHGHESARKLTSTLLVHSVQLSGRRTDEFQNRLCLLNLVREALEDSNGRRRRNEESNSLAGEFEMMRNLLVTRGNPALQRASG